MSDLIQSVAATMKALLGLSAPKPDPGPVLAVDNGPSSEAETPTDPEGPKGPGPKGSGPSSPGPSAPAVVAAPPPANDPGPEPSELMRRLPPEVDAHLLDDLIENVGPSVLDRCVNLFEGWWNDARDPDRPLDFIRREGFSLDAAHGRDDPDRPMVPGEEWGFILRRDEESWGVRYRYIAPFTCRDGLGDLCAFAVDRGGETVFAAPLLRTTFRLKGRWRLVLQETGVCSDTRWAETFHDLWRVAFRQPQVLLNADRERRRFHARLQAERP